jgi:hypothetical protein
LVTQQMNMENGKKHKLPNLKELLLILLIMLILVFSISCSNYVQFSSDIKALDFTFEYPKKWEITSPEIFPDYVYFNIWEPSTSDNESKVVIGLNNWIGKGADADAEALSKVQAQIEEASKGPNYSLIRQEGIILDGVKGYAGEYFYDRLNRYNATSQDKSYFNMREMDVCLPKDGNVYEIWISASQNKWNLWSEDIQHILDTFRWK